jgi:hypothetical protein
MRETPRSILAVRIIVALSLGMLAYGLWFAAHDPWWNTPG